MLLYLDGMLCIGSQKGIDVLVSEIPQMWCFFRLGSDYPPF